jgi:hypothetical protein
MCSKSTCLLSEHAHVVVVLYSSHELFVPFPYRSVAHFAITCCVQEFFDLLGEEEEENDESAERSDVGKIEPFGADEVREVMVRRKRDEIDRQREDKARREAFAADLDRKIFEEELKASASRAGGANPKRLDKVPATTEYVVGLHWRFFLSSSCFVNTS